MIEVSAIGQDLARFGWVWAAESGRCPNSAAHQPAGLPATHHPTVKSLARCAMSAVTNVFPDSQSRYSLGSRS